VAEGKCIILDLDGTLLDCRERLYTLFSELVPGCTLTAHEYWELKRKKNTHDVILKNLFGWSDERIQEFEVSWLNKIENKKYLNLDKPVENATNFLKQVSLLYHTVLLTSRQLPENVFWQLNKLKWSKYFNEVQVSAGRKKVNILKRMNLAQYNTVYMVGDTGEDIQAAQTVGAIAVAVINGFRDEQVLKTYSPDLLLPSIVDFLKIMQKYEH
jgi:phosphoglycolate phosphatase